MRNIKDFLKLNSSMEFPYSGRHFNREQREKYRAVILVQLAKKDKKPIEIVPGLFIGSLASIIFPEQLKKMGITHVVSAMKGVKLISVIVALKLETNRTALSTSN